MSGLPTASGSISVATTGKIPMVAQDGGGGGAAAAQPNDADADLQARLDNLRRKWTIFLFHNQIKIYVFIYKPILM